MIKRVRDKLSSFKPQDVISADQWQKIEENFARASQFMTEENPVYQIFLNELKEAERIVLENRIHEVREIRFISEIMQKIFVTPREEQLNELVGQIKFIRGFLAELQSWIDSKKNLERLEADGKIIIRRFEKNGG